MRDVVLDSSVIVAAVLQEPGGHRAVGHPKPPLMSAVNYAEVRSRLADLGMTVAGIDVALEMFGLDVVSFDRAQAVASADLRPATRGAGLSLGDRACLALASSREAVALTADRIWAKIDLPVEIEVVR